MGNKQHVEILRRGVDTWNQWRHQQPSVQPDLSGESLQRQDLSHIDLHDANCSWTNCNSATLIGADCRGTNFFGSDLGKATLINANLERANLERANISSTPNGDANLTGARLSGANLIRSVMAGTILKNAILNDCHVYGISAWNLDIDNVEQKNLIITPPGEPEISVDNLEVAQFVFLLLNNRKLREVIDNISSKVVLILGRFTPERKAVLDMIREELRRYDYLPIMFDFEKPEGRNYTETVSTLAHMARFIIADVTDALVVLQELEHVVPKLPSVPVQPILLQGTEKNKILRDFEDYPWFLKLYCYQDLQSVGRALKAEIITPAEAKAKEIEVRRKRAMEED